MAQIYTDYLWNNGTQILLQKNGQGVFYKFDANTNLDIPVYLSTVEMDKTLNLDSFLTARVKKCIINQVSGILRGAIEKQRKRQFFSNNRRAQTEKVPHLLRKALRKNKPVKPDVSRINPELNSVCLEYQEDDRCFNGWLKLFSFTTETRNKSIYLPIQHHRHSNRLRKNNSRIMSSFLLTEKSVDIRWELNPERNKGTDTHGADPGMNVVLSLSDKQVTPEKDIHGHSLNSILEKISRKKCGSKSIKKSYEHRENFINWSINQLDFSKIKELRYEKNRDVRKYKSSYHGSSLSHWMYTLIHSKVKSKCELEGVLLVEHEDSTYMSQRCHLCGMVKKSQRAGSIYSCENCGYVGDADYNSSCNHQQNLYELPYGFRKLKLNRSGFLWKELGLFELTGEALAVPLPEN